MKRSRARRDQRETLDDLVEQTMQELARRDDADVELIAKLDQVRRDVRHSRRDRRRDWRVKRP